MRPLLLCRAGDDEGLARLVGEEPLLIGRAKDCGFALADPQASRRHSRVCMHAGTLRAEDLDSVLGTIVNGRRLATGEVAELRHQDVLTIADTQLVVVDLDCVARGEVAAACIVGPGDFRVPLRRGSNVIGSAPDCDLVVDDPEVPPRHADLVLGVEGCRLVRDPASTPLFVNGEPISSDIDLASGDVFQLSPHAYFGVEVHVGTGLTPWAPPPPVVPDGPTIDERGSERAAEGADAPATETLQIPAEPPAFGAPMTPASEARDDGERTHASPVVTHEPPETTSALKLEEIRAAIEKARQRHAAEVARSGTPDDSAARAARTPIPIATARSPQPRPPMPAPDFRAARREAAVRIHVVVPGADPVIVLLREGSHYLGRSERCRVRIAHPSVAMEHAELAVGPQGVRVRALSPEGLVLRDGRRLADATITPGEKILFGEMEAWFEEL